MEILQNRVFERLCGDELVIQGLVTRLALAE